MRSPRDERDSGDADDAFTTVQDTLDAFDAPKEHETADALVVPTDDPQEDPAISVAPDILPALTRQESIDRFAKVEAPTHGPAPSPGRSRAMEGLAMEAAMERVALTEAASGISRDELVIIIAREVQIPLERLDLVDGYLTDLELEDRVRVVGELVVLRHDDDGDLMAMDLTDDEFLARYRRRYLDREGVGRP